jgi:hypothetical protein
MKITQDYLTNTEKDKQPKESNTNLRLTSFNHESYDHRLITGTKTLVFHEIRKRKNTKNI